MRLLIVEDDASIARFVARGLAQAGYCTDSAHTGDDAIHMAITTRYVAAVVDVALPDRSGLDVVAELRARGINMPVLGLSCRSGLQDRVAGLNAGCDDYLAKPFAFQELLARLRALLRGRGAVPIHLRTCGGVRIDPATRSVTRDGVPIDLSRREYALLALLMSEPGRVFSRAAILDAVWGEQYDHASNVLDVYVKLLRKKLDAGFPTPLLQTVRGVGYVLREEPARECAAAGAADEGEAR